MLGKVFVGDRVSNLDTGEKPARISRVNLLVDSDHMYTAGDDTGRTIEKTCPWGTQAMANSILSRLQNVVYQPFSGTDGLLDPAAELGDGVTVGGVYSVLAKADITFDGLYSADIAAPGGDEVEDEYPYRSRARRQADRELAQIRSSITKTADQIVLLVENEIDGLEGKLTLTASNLTSQIKNANSEISTIKQYVDSITLSVSNGSTSSSIVLKAGNATIASQTIQMNGLVSFTGLANGTTTINGACIQTGTIDAEYLDLTGAITFSDLSRSLRDDINDAYAMAEDAQSLANDLNETVGGWMYRGTTYIDGGMLMTGTVKASQLLGGTVGLLDAYERVVGGINITRTETGDGLEFYTDYGGIRISAGGHFWVDAAYGSFGITDSGVICKADCVPESSGWYTLGGPGHNWSDVYADNDTIITSDREKKRDITYDLAAYDRFFDALRPAAYRLRGGRSGRTHLGLIAQDVETALEDCDLTAMDFAGLVRTPREGGGVDYALRYGEFIPLLIMKYQTLAARVAELERRIFA